MSATTNSISSPARRCPRIGLAIILAAAAQAIAQISVPPAATAPASTQPQSDEPTTGKPLSLIKEPTSAPVSPKPGFIILPNAGFLIWPSPEPLTGTIATDRPGFSDTTSVVPRGHLQLESGFTYTYDRGPHHARLQTFDYPELSLRIGVLSDLEARVGWTGEVYSRTRYLAKTRAGRTTTFLDTDQGGADMKVGLKWAMTRQDGFIPNLSLIPSLYLPTGAEGYTTGDVDPEVRIAYSWLALEKLTVYGVVQLSSVSDSDGRFFQCGASAAASYQITDKLAGILEYYFVDPITRGSDSSQNLNVCATYLITPNAQFDIRVGFGLNDDAPDFSTSAGLSFRF